MWSLRQERNKIDYRNKEVKDVKIFNSCDFNQDKFTNKMYTNQILSTSYVRIYAGFSEMLKMKTKSQPSKKVT